MADRRHYQDPSFTDISKADGRPPPQPPAEGSRQSDQTSPRHSTSRETLYRPSGPPPPPPPSRESSKAAASRPQNLSRGRAGFGNADLYPRLPVGDSEDPRNGRQPRHESRQSYGDSSNNKQKREAYFRKEREQDLRYPSQRDLRGSRENLDDKNGGVNDLKRSRENLDDRRSAGDFKRSAQYLGDRRSVQDFKGSRQNLDQGVKDFSSQNPNNRFKNSTQNLNDGFQGPEQNSNNRRPVAGFKGSRQHLNDDSSPNDVTRTQQPLDNRSARSGFRPSTGVPTGTAPPRHFQQPNFRGSREFLDERNVSLTAQKGMKGSRENLDSSNSRHITGSRDALNGKDLQYASRSNLLGSREVLTKTEVPRLHNTGTYPRLHQNLSDPKVFSPKREIYSGRDERVYPTLSSKNPDTKCVEKGSVMQLPTGPKGDVMMLPQAESVSTSTSGSSFSLTSSTTKENEANARREERYLRRLQLGQDQAQGRFGSRGLVNVAMDDTISEEPSEETNAGRESETSLDPVFATHSSKEVLSGFGSKFNRPNFTAMVQKAKKAVATDSRPWFDLWICISFVLVFSTLFGIVPLIFFWQARHEWEVRDKAKASKSLRNGKISLLVVLLVFAGACAYLGYHISVVNQQIHDEYQTYSGGHQDPQQQQQGVHTGNQGQGQYGNLLQDQYNSNTWLANHEMDNVAT